jgi:DNA-binding response OmpR family regulator
MSKRRVMVVDDDRHAREALALLLADEGYEVLAAADGAAALAALARFSPDVIITDVSMPRMDGPALAAAVQALPGVAPKVIWMSARERPVMGAPFVQKPIAFDELLALI